MTTNGKPQGLYFWQVCYVKNRGKRSLHEADIDFIFLSLEVVTFLCEKTVSRNHTEVCPDVTCKASAFQAAKHRVFYLFMLTLGIVFTKISLFHPVSLVFFISLLLLQVSSLISALVVLLVLLFFAPFFHALQKCVLACIIIVSLRGALRKFMDIPAKWRASQSDAIVWLVTMSTTVLISVELGLLVGIVFSMICIIFKTQNPKVSDLMLIMERKLIQIL